MKYDLKTLVDELERQKNSKWDVITNGNSIQYVKDDNDIKIAFNESEQRQLTDTFGTISLEYPLTRWAHSQLAQKLDIPERYYYKMLGEDKELLMTNVNTWLQSKQYRSKKYLIRVLDDKIRAFLSNRFLFIENLSLVYFLLENLKQYDVSIEECAITDTKMYIKVLQNRQIAVREDDYMIPGLILWNSEVGASFVRIEPFLLRKVCSNGLIGKHGLGRIHLGTAKPTGIITWSDTTNRLQNSLIRSQCSDAIRHCFDQSLQDKWMNAIRNGAKFVFDDEPEIVCYAIQLHTEMTKDEREILLNHYADEENNLFGLVNGITRTARDKKVRDYDRSIELEIMANELIMTSPHVIKRWIDESKEKVKK